MTKEQLDELDAKVSRLRVLAGIMDHLKNEVAILTDRSPERLNLWGPADEVGQAFQVNQHLQSKESREIVKECFIRAAEIQFADAKKEYDALAKEFDAK